MKQKKYQSYVLWTAVAAQLISLGQLTGLFAMWGLDAGVVGNVVAGVLQMLVVLGIINNPNDKNSF
jgi:uncharacterized membrane protein